MCELAYCRIEFGRCKCVWMRVSWRIVEGVWSAEWVRGYGVCWMAGGLIGWSVVVVGVHLVGGLANCCGCCVICCCCSCTNVELCPASIASSVQAVGPSNRRYWCVFQVSLSCCAGRTVGGHDQLFTGIAIWLCSSRFSQAATGYLARCWPTRQLAPLLRS